MHQPAVTVTYRTYANAHTFRWAVEPFLLREEARNCLVLDILGGALLQGRVAEPYLATVDRDGRPTLAALRTPPRRLILVGPTDLATGLATDLVTDPPAGLATDLITDAAAGPATGVASDGATDVTTGAARDPDYLAPLLHHLPAGLPGVIGPREQVEEFAHLYALKHGVVANYVRTERVYECTAVQDGFAAPGGLRRAAQQEAELVTGWWSAFRREATPHEPDDSRAAVGADLRRNELRQMRPTEYEPSEGLWVWVADGQPVAMAGLRGRTKNGVRVGPVYTPPELRRRGYAGALVAQLTRQLLSGDRRAVYLFTDDANVTSNALYQRIGYREVAVRVMYDFAPADAGASRGGHASAAAPDEGRRRA